MERSFGFRTWLAALTLLATVVSACGGGSGATPSGAASAPASAASNTTQPNTATAGKTIAVLSPDYGAQPAAKEAIDDFVADAEGRGYKVTVVDTNSDNAAMNGEIATAASRHVDAIVIAFGTPQEFGEGLAKAAAAQVPVFGLDTGGIVEPILVNVTTDNNVLGRESAQALIDAMGGRGSVIMIHYDPFEPVRLRAAAAKALFDEKGIKIIEYVLGDPADSTGFAKRTVFDLLTKYPKGQVQGIWAGWDASGLGAYQATQEAGRSEVFITSVDGQDFARAEVAKGLNWVATVRQDWPVIAKTLRDIITDYFAGKTPTEKIVYVPARVITPQNAK
ncbi:MAG: hypothetical protein C4321_01985 [Chloroflexota bacterium]